MPSLKQQEPVRSGRSLQTQIDLPYTPVQVWAVLSDLESWSTWNPFIVKAAAPNGLRPKAKLDLTMHMKGMAPQHFKPQILVAEAGVELRWLGRTGLPGIFDGEHHFRMEALPDGGTRLWHGEQFRGLLARPLVAWMGDKLPAAFTAMNEALAGELAHRNGNAAGK